MFKKVTVSFTTILVALIFLGLPSTANAKSETISGQVSEYVRKYNTQRYKRHGDGVTFNGSLAKRYCVYRNWDNPDLWDKDIAYIEYGTWSLGLRRASNNLQFTRLEFTGQKGSGAFPSTFGTDGTYFKINTKGSHCGDTPIMPFSGTLNY